MPPDNAQETLVDKAFRRLKNNPFVAFLLVVVVIVIGIAQFTDALTSIRDFLRPPNSTQTVAEHRPKADQPPGPGPVREEPSEHQGKTETGLPNTGQTEKSPEHLKTKLESQSLPTVEQYLNTATTNRESVREVALLILDEKKQSQVQMEQAIANLLAQQGAQPLQSFFTSAFVQEGHARALFDGQWQIAQDLELNTRIDNLILGFARVSYSKNPEYQGLLTANLILELKCFDFQLQRICGTRSLSVTGAGYTQQKALETAVRGIVPQLEVYVSDSF
jgi:hypothetical protein